MRARLQRLFRSVLARLRALPWRQGLRQGWKPALVVFAAAFVGLWLAAPIDPAMQRIIREAEQQTGAEIHVDRASMGLFGPVLRDVQVRQPLRLRIDEVRLRPTLSFLWFRPAVAVSLRRDDGRIDARLGFGYNRDIRVELDAWNLTRSQLGLSLPYGLSLQGDLGGEADLRLPAGSPYDLTGTVGLELQNASLQSDGLVPLPNEALRLGTVRAQLNAAQGRIEIERIQIDGPDLHGTLRGRVELRRPINRSLLDLTVRLRFEDELRNTLGPLLPMIGFRPERDAFVREMRGTLGVLLSGG